MFNIILTVHAILCFAMIILVLLQQGKGADMGAAFGGGSNSIFGASGATDFITKLTTGVAVAFMFTSIMLVRSYSGVAVAAPSSAGNPLEGSIMQEEIAAKNAEAAATATAIAQPTAAAVTTVAAAEVVATATPMVIADVKTEKAEVSKKTAKKNSK